MAATSPAFSSSVCLNSFYQSALTLELDLNSLGPNGEVKNDLYNIKGNPKYKYYYSDAGSVVAGLCACSLLA